MASKGYPRRRAPEKTGVRRLFRPHQPRAPGAL